MSIIHKKPVTPTQRYLAQNRPEEITAEKPLRALVVKKNRSGGRNCYGRMTMRRRGGGHKRNLRIIDFLRNKIDIPAKVKTIEYDPNRSALIALLAYADGEKRYIVAPRDVKVGDTLVSSNKAGSFDPGNSFPLEVIPPGIVVHNVELVPGQGARIARSAGSGMRLVAVEGDHATLKLPSGEIRLVHKKCRATVGEVGNRSHQNATIGKAGRSRWLGKRPRVRGMVMNPVDHPNGGGNGKSKGGGGRQQLVSPWGQLAKSYPTRTRSKPSNSLILVNRKGKKFN